MRKLNVRKTETTYFKVAAASQQGCLKIIPNLPCAHSSHCISSMAGLLPAGKAAGKAAGCVCMTEKVRDAILSSSADIWLCTTLSVSA